MGRILTESEKILCKKIFKHSINYSKVRIHAEKAIFFQPNNSGMTPNGEIYIDGLQISDYGLAGFSDKAFFIHEMAHVWQKQNQVLNPILSAIGNAIFHFGDYNQAYYYQLDSSKDLLDYRMEQQAQIIEDYTRFKLFNITPKSSTASRRYLINEGLDRQTLISLYEAVLQRFLQDPAYPNPNAAPVPRKVNLK